MKQIAATFSFLLLCSVACADFTRGAAYDPTISPDRFDQRQRYLDAMHMIRTSQFSRLQKVKPQLIDYPLYPYLIYTEMAYRISRQGESDILGFVEKYKDTPLTEPLLQHWLSNLAKRNQHSLLVQYYDRVAPTKELACQHAWALYKLGHHAEAMTAAENLWTVGFSQPDECDPIFAAWRNDGGMTREIAWERFSLSLQENEKKLSNYLLRFIHKQDKPYASNYRLVHLKPKTIQRISAFKKPHTRNQEIILHGVRRLARTDPVAAMDTLRTYEQYHQFEPDDLDGAYADIGIRLTGKSDDLALAESLPVNLQAHPKLIEARLRQSLKHADWSNVIILINLLPEAEREKARWQYWKARVLAQSSDIADREIARELFAELSKSRTFYGFLSADILKTEYSFEDEPHLVTQASLLAVEQSPGIQRALELFAIGERSRARREWYFTTAHMADEDKEIAAQVALRWGWYKAAIQVLIEAEAWNHLDDRFPFGFQDTFITHARRANVPVEWSFAVARQESAFMPDAKSKSGALGVMQLMPATAKIVANKLGVKYANNGKLTEPDLNIRLGTNYLGQMLRRFDNNRILASAAYNAGPGRVDKWLDPSIAFDVWIEIIPFTETRNYVQNVLMFSNIYSRRMQEKAPLVYPHERDYFSEAQISLGNPPVERLPEAS